MSRKRPSPSPSRRPKAKVPAPGPSSNDPQLSHTSKTLLQVPQIDIRVTGEEVGSRAASPPFTSVPPSPDASDHLEASPSLLRRISRWTKSRIESLSPQAGSAAATDQKNTTLNAIKLLLQTSAAALKFAPIPQLDQIPNTLLAWINIYESATTNVEDMEKLHIVIRQVRDSVLQPLQEWTGEIPPELENLSRDFYAALRKQLEEIESVQCKNLPMRAIKAPDITQQISGMKNCLNDAVSQFQLRISTLTLLRTERLSVQSELSRLKPVAAEYIYVKSKSECLEGTRVRTQASLLESLKAPETRFVWLRGPPGTGKTAISMSIASTLDAQDALAASFFWDKNQAGTGLDSIEHFPSTLAHQLASFSEGFKTSLVKHLRQPSLGFIKSLPLFKQMSTLIVEPMRDAIEMQSSGKNRFVIILDGLDECGNPGTLRALMELVLQLRDLPSSFAMLVSSRPETQVVQAWARARSMGHVIPCEDTDKIDKNETFHTIRRMVDKGLKDCISESSWQPSEEDLNAFTSACRGLPVIASLRIREVCVRTEQGTTFRLELEYFRDLIDAPTDLNSEYLRILRRAYFPDSLSIRPSVIENYRLVVGMIALAREPLSLYSIAKLLQITEEEVYATLRPISSIIDLPSTGQGRPKFYHATAKELIAGQAIGDAGDSSFFIGTDEYSLGLPLLRFLEGTFERDYMMAINNPLGDEERWKEFLGRELPEHVQYAVKYLFSHLNTSKLLLQDSNELQQAFDRFLTQNLLIFIALSDGKFALPDELLRSNNHNSTELLREAKRANEYVNNRYRGNALKPEVLTTFYPWHIFRSMLPFTSNSSPLFKLYHHLSDPVQIFSISGEFTGHLIPLSEHALSARMVMETKLGRLPKEIDREGLEVIHYEAEYRDRDIRSGTVTSAAISKDGRQVALGFGNGDIEVVDIDRQHTLTRFQCDSRSPPVWIVIPNSHGIATEDDEGNVFTFDHSLQPASQIINHYDYWNKQLVKFGTLPSGHRPPVTAVADDASFIVRLPRHLGPNWPERVVILYLSGEPSIHVLSSPSSMPTAVPTRPPPIPVGLTVELSPGGRYVVACDANRAFIWSTKSREFIASHHLPDSETFTSHAIPSRTYIISGARRPPTLSSEHGIDNIGDFRVERDLDKLWLESQPHTHSLEVLARRQAYSLNRARIGTPNPELWLNNTLKLILPIEYHPIILNNDYPREWYGDRVIGDEDFIYFPHASKDGTRFLVQGRMRAPIVVDISQIV